jgi:hypothetical protein
MCILEMHCLFFIIEIRKWNVVSGMRNVAVAQESNSNTIICKCEFHGFTEYIDVNNIIHCPQMTILKNMVTPGSICGEASMKRDSREKRRSSQQSPADVINTVFNNKMYRCERQCC